MLVSLPSSVPVSTLSSVSSGGFRCQHSATVTAASALACFHPSKVRAVLSGANKSGYFGQVHVIITGHHNVKAWYYLFNQCRLCRVFFFVLFFYQPSHAQATCSVRAQLQSGQTLFCTSSHIQGEYWNFEG